LPKFRRGGFEEGVLSGHCAAITVVAIAKTKSDYHRISAGTRMPCVNQLIVPFSGDHHGC